jgi:kynureninase
MDFTATRALFHLPDGVIYLDGNSLGPLPKTAASRVKTMMEAEWGELLIRGWNEAGWYVQPRKTGNRIARLIGAPPGTVTVGDTLSIRVFQALASAIDIAAKRDTARKIILSDTGNFPTDLYMAQGLIDAMGRGHELLLVEPDAVETALQRAADDGIAVLMLTEVDYRTGRKHDMAALTATAREFGVVTVWDLAHSAGALPVDVTGAGADFAAGCTYKYLNGGPGAPAFQFVAPEHADHVSPILPGWMGHDSPFAFNLGYTAGPGVERMRIGTPPVIALAALDASLDIWDGVDIQALRQRSMMLTDLLIADVARACPQLPLASPHDAQQRGSQVSFRLQNGYAAVQALIARGVIGDFRAPDLMRFGIAPLYNSEDDIRAAAAAIADVINTGAWNEARFQQQRVVT